MKRALTLLTLLVVAWPVATAAQSPEPSSPKEVEAAEEGEDKAEESGDSDEQPASPFVSGPLEVMPRDQGYGAHTPIQAHRFSESLSEEAPVDTPLDRYSMGDKNVLVPSAATPDEGTWILSSHNLLVNHLSYGLKDDIELSLGIRIPTADADFISSFSSKFKLVDERMYAISVQPFAAYANGIRRLDTSQFGLGSGLLFDWKVHDTVVVHFGGYGFLNVLYTYNTRDTSECGTRSEFGPDCIGVNTSTKAFPSGGHWVSASTGVTWFLGDSFSLHGEVLLGGVSGTFFGVEDNADAQDAEVPEPVDRSPFEDPTFKTGFPHGSGPTWSFGVGYGGGGFGMQLDFVMFRNTDDPSTLVTDESQEYRLLPVLAASYAF